MELKFKVHSIVDVITNSSSELYTINKNKIKENIEEILETLTFLANTELDYKDIFVIDVSSDGGGISVYTKEDEWEDYLSDKEYYKEDGEWEAIEKRFRFLKENPELVKKIEKSLQALFSFEYIDL